MKKDIDVFDYANVIMKNLKKGVLVTTKHNDKVNSMTISWGMLGIKWRTNVFTIFVRENRFTKRLLDETAEFTINVPNGDFDKKILAVCGTKSGVDTDKIEALGLTLVEPSVISAPAIKELPLTLECKVLYKQEQDKNAIPEDIKTSIYPQDIDSSFHGANKDFHTAYYGEIVAAYIMD